jgi:hypothetical protein
MATFHVLTVRNPERPDREALKLTFTSRKAYHAVDQELWRLGYDVERDPGYKLFNSVEEALDSVEPFLGRMERKPRYGEPRK